MAKRVISSKKEFNVKKFFMQWEWVLVVLIIAVNIVNARISPYYLSVDSLLGATMVFLDKAFIVLPMTFIIILGDIDISVASTMALSSVLMAVSYNAGVSMPVAILIALLTGTVCGFINGYIISRFKELSAMIVTLATMSIYRGIAYVILGDQASGGFPSWFSELGWGYVGNTDIPIILAVFVIFAVVFGILLHRTTFGRRVYAIGNNIYASTYSGVSVGNIKTVVFTITGIMSAIAGIFLTSKLGSSRPNIATGYELEVIAITVLGGIHPSGGRGRIIGAVLSVFLVGLMRYGMGLKNISGQVMMIIIGALLIIAIMMPNILGKVNIRKKNIIKSKA